MKKTELCEFGFFMISFWVDVGIDPYGYLFSFAEITRRRAGACSCRKMHTAREWLRIDVLIVPYRIFAGIFEQKNNG